jgi:hypothetical protein
MTRAKNKSPARKPCINRERQGPKLRPEQQKHQAMERKIFDIK